jgi:hypothetical protein
MPANDPQDPTVRDGPVTARTRGAPVAGVGAADRFRPVREIARGGMGRVIEAVDTQLGRTVAVKQALDADPEARLRFTREVEITARLEHPSIVPLYDAGVSAAGDPFYVMRKVSGAPLDALIAEATTLDQRLSFLPNVLAVADAIAHAHGRGVIHRDLKPSNVLIGELGETVVIDWGLAKLIGEDDAPRSRRADVPRAPLVTTAGTVFGTPGFMAPEQVTADETDARSDVYALGACLYSVLAGVSPFHGLPEAEMLARTVAGPLAPLPALVPGVPPDLVTIVEKAMSRDPAQRYLDAGGLSEDLRRFLTGQLVASHRYGAGQRLLRWLRQHRALVAVIGIALAILIVIGAVALRRIVAAQGRTEAALARERDRSDEIIVTQAFSLLDRDPTLAIATLQELRPDSPRWASLGPTIAAARARGVAVGYPGHGPGMTRVELPHDPDDTRVLTAGGGVVRLQDLARRTSTVLVELHIVFAEFAGPLVVITGRPLPHSPYLLDPVSKAEAVFPWPTEIAYSRGTHDAVVFADRDGKLAALDLRAGLPLSTVPVEIPIGIRVDFVWFSDGGRYLIAGDDRRMRILRRDGDALRWTIVGDLPYATRNFAFDPDDTRIAIVGQDVGNSVVIELELDTLTETGRWATGSPSTVKYADDHLYAMMIGREEFARLLPGGKVVVLSRFDGSNGASLAAAAGGLVMLQDRRTIEVIRGGTRHVIRPPLDVETIAGHGRYLLGANASNVLVWDLDEIVPARIDVPLATRLAFFSPRLAAAFGEIESSPLRTTYRYALGAKPPALSIEKVSGMPFGFQPILTPDGLLIGRSFDGTIIVANPAVTVEPGTTTASRTGDGDVLTGGRAGALHLIDPETGADTVLARLPEIVAIAERGGWIAAQSKAGSLWRRDPAGRIDTTQVPGSYLGIAITSRGEVVVGTADGVAAWPVGARASSVVAPLPQPPIGLLTVTGDRVVIHSQDGAVWRYEPETRALRQILPATTTLTFSLDRTRAAALIDNAVVVVDLATGQRWTVLDRIQLALDALALSPDGRDLLAGEPERSRTGGSHLSWWRIEVPEDPRGWVETATNARKPSLTNGTIDWRPLSASR